MIRAGQAGDKQEILCTPERLISALPFQSARSTETNVMIDRVDQILQRTQPMNWDLHALVSSFSGMFGTLNMSINVGV